MGLPDVDVCCQLAQGSRATDWIDAQTGEATRGCMSLIHRSYEAFAVAVHTALYIGLFFLVIVSAMKRISRRAQGGNVTFSCLEYKPGRHVMIVR